MGLMNYRQLGNQSRQEAVLESPENKDVIKMGERPGYQPKTIITVTFVKSGQSGFKQSRHTPHHSK